jgi:hypothetical protein
MLASRLKLEEVLDKHGGPTGRGVALAAFSIAATLGLAGCGGAADDVMADPGSPTPSATSDTDAEPEDGVITSEPEAVEATEGPTTNAAPAVAPESTTPAEPFVEPDPPGSDPVAAADCLPGNWYLDNEGFASVLTLNDIPDEDAVTGVLMMTFHEDGTVETLYEDWSFTYSGSGAATLARDGTDHGTYAVASDGSVSLSDTSIDSTTLVTQEVEGVEQTTEEDAMSQFSSTTFTCIGDELTPNDFVKVWALHREH